MEREVRGWRQRLAGPGGSAGRVLLAMVGLVGLGAATGAGCAKESTGPESGATEGVGVAAQALGTTPTCVTLQRPPTGGVVVDTGLVNKSPAKTYGTAWDMNAGFDQFAKASLLRFDLSGIPGAAPNTRYNVSATLKLALGWQGALGPGNVDVHRALAPWSETTTTWQSFGGAFAPAVVASAPNSTSVLSFDVSLLVADWLNGLAPNYGFYLDQQGPNLTNLWASEALPEARRPSLDLCYTLACASGFADCDGQAANGCETNLGTVTDCGACGVACSAPHATPACVAGACTIAACALGFADCNGLAADGCETALTTNTSCGGCGVACALPHATTSCASGSCALVACDVGFSDCDGDPSNGCEPLPCNNGSTCTSGAQCAGGVCQNGVCVTATCTDGAQNGGETDVDCGGATACPRCATGQTCAAGSDCQGGVCQGGVCQAAACNDALKNGGETDVDCGGATSCPRCATGQTCVAGSDCQSGVCTGGVCQAPSCYDGIQNGGETAPDCGGPNACPRCVPGKGCLTGSDCTDQVCQGGVCQMASCADGVKNGAETDVDCGGTCAPCGGSQQCTTSADCQSGVCVGGYCQTPSCSDGVKNGNETGVDCGGSCARPEVCNGLDDDCNGLIDEGLGNITCGIGACQRTVPSCANGVPQTCVPGTPGVEVCDGLGDEDCDGVVDNGCGCTNGATQPCYTGAPATLGVGACHAGTQTCAHGQWGACVGEATPTAEACDGADNDCNGSVDDGLGQTVCGVGGCQVTVQNCVNGQPQACAPTAPQAETCDGVDNDCNGQVDDGLAPVTCGVGACQRTVPSCANGAPQTCTPGAPSAEVCDGLDNDCDGQVDEGNPGGGMACSTGKLGVCAAGATACTAGAIVCDQTAQPSAETCDGLDNDCNGQIDDGNPGGGAACSTGKLGVCAAGTTVCSGGGLSCQQTNQPSAETCDGLDNDCDGQIDDGNPGGGAACSTGLLGACAAGTTACTAGGVVCTQTTQPSAEVCNGTGDENCNGQIDEGCSCVNGATRSCYSGPAGTSGVGACRAGTQTCAGGQWGACAGEVLPTAETCDNVDNNCNGQVDDGLGTISCGVGQCGRTVAACVNGQANTCTPGAPTAEVCDGLDNDCDGVVDDGNPGAGAACSTGKLGVCAAGTTACVSGALVCNQTTQAQAETCDGKDNDCDGAVDDGNPGGGAACSTGQLGICAAGTTVCSGGSVVCNRNQAPTTETCNGLDDNCNGTADETGCASCANPSGGTTPHGGTLTQYQSTNACGSTCQSQTRTCNNGTWSSPFTYSAATCSTTCLSCTVDAAHGGGTLAHNATRIGYTTSSVACGGSCSSVQKTMTCVNGVMNYNGATTNTCSVSVCTFTFVSFENCQTSRMMVGCGNGTTGNFCDFLSTNTTGRFYPPGYSIPGTTTSGHYGSELLGYTGNTTYDAELYTLTQYGMSGVGGAVGGPAYLCTQQPNLNAHFRCYSIGSVLGIPYSPSIVCTYY